MAEVQRACVLDFCHRKDAPRIDTNMYHCIDLPNNNGEIEKHVGQVFNVPTTREQFAHFQQSATVIKYKKQYGGNLITPG
eukprot:6707515-Ditylum_brightwellii.AAC.1